MLRERRRVASLAVAGALLAGPVLARKDWTKSKWGPDDKIGAANLITEESVMEAAKLVTAGKTCHLGIIVDSKTPAFPPRTLSVSILQPNQTATTDLGENTMTDYDGIFMGWPGIGPQIDELGHATPSTITATRTATSPRPTGRPSSAPRTCRRP